MRQYNSIKEQVPNALLMFRLGDFYELFFEDAVVAARELEITLTARNKEKGAAIPMCGVPYHAAEGYISRLIQKGYRVAICDQMEDPKARQETGQARDHARRHARHRDGLQPGALAREQLPGRRGAAPALAPPWPTSMSPPASSGSPRWSPPKSPARSNTWARARSCFPGDLPLLTGEDRAGPRFVRTELEDWVFTHDYADRTLRDHFKLLSLDGCGLANRPAAVGAAGAILHYLRDTQRAALDHLDRPTYYDRADSMVLDAVTVRNLELIEPLFAADAGGRRRSPPCSACSIRP